MKGKRDRRRFAAGERQAYRSRSTATPQEVAAMFDALGTGAIEEYAEFVPKGMQAGRHAEALRGPARRSAAARRRRRHGYAFGAEFVEVRVHRPHRARSACRALSAPSPPAASSTRAPRAASSWAA